METFFNTFFDFSFMADHLGEILAGFWITIKLSLVGGFFALIWGRVLSLLRPLPG